MLALHIYLIHSDVLTETFINIEDTLKLIVLFGKESDVLHIE